MSPQPSNRQQLLEGTLRCLEKLPPERVTARVIAAESEANLASIAYHFGSKDNLVTEAVILGLDRWLVEITQAMGDVSASTPALRFQRATEALAATQRQHTGLARNFVTALARGQHDERLRALLYDGVARTRESLAVLLALGDDPAGTDAGGLVLALFYGLLIQDLIAPDLAIAGKRMTTAQSRLREALP